MLFSSLIFIFAFLPAVIAVYYLVPRKGKNTVLMLSSLIFYMWGGVSLSAILFTSILFNYLFGLWINKCERGKKVPLVIGIIFNLLMLGTFKYGNFLVENINHLLNLTGINPVKDPGIILPLGISFFTFQSMSYLIDVYRKETPVQKNLFYLALYISFFPQLIAGPIVRYHDLAPQLLSRKESLPLFSSGVERFIIGLVKKVIIANQFAIISHEAFSIPIDVLPQSLAWAGMISYSFQIYFDFAGYSDMAIGLGLMFGFHLPENFNFPYLATSIRKFWKSWHITLGQWLMDYLYIPLGGNRKSNLRTYFNLLIIFIVCGFWHGASWNFLLWGLVHGAFMAVERFWLEKNVLNRAGKIIPVLYTFSIATFAWVLFETKDFEHTKGFYKVLFLGNDSMLGSNYLSLLFKQNFLFIAIPSVLGSFGFFRWLNNKLTAIMPEFASQPIVKGIKVAVMLIAIFTITLLLISNTYNPFIYFRF